MIILAFLFLLFWRNSFTGSVINKNNNTPLESVTIITTGTNWSASLNRYFVRCRGVILSSTTSDGKFRAFTYGLFGNSVTAVAYLPGYEHLTTVLPSSFPTRLRDKNHYFDDVIIYMAESSNTKHDRLLYLHGFINDITREECENEPSVLSIYKTILNEAKNLVSSRFDRFIYHNMELMVLNKSLDNSQLKELEEVVNREKQEIISSQHIKMFTSFSEERILSYIESLSELLTPDEVLSELNFERNIEHRTPLMIAAMNGHKYVVGSLLQHGASPNSINRKNSLYGPEDALTIALSKYTHAISRGDSHAQYYYSIMELILSSGKYRPKPIIAGHLKTIGLDIEQSMIDNTYTNRGYQ